MMFSAHFLAKREILDEFKQSENRLLQIYEEFPSDWFLHRQIVDTLQKIDNILERNVALFQSSPAGKIAQLLNRHLETLFKQIRVYIQLVERHIKKIVWKKIDPKITMEVRNSMKKIIDSLHLLYFYAQLYPVHKIHNKRALKQVLEGLRKGIYIPADIDQQEAVKLVSSFTKSELILLVQFQTSEKPYLLIVNNLGKMRLQIVKRKHIQEDVVISKLMSLLGINHMIIDSQHKLIGDKVEYLNYIEYLRGIKLLEMGRMTNKLEILSFAFLLGAACADAYALNLSDRPFNVYIDYNYFNKIYAKNPVYFLGVKNPIFHVDYEFWSNTDGEAYLESQIFGTKGLFVSLFVDNVSLIKAKLIRQQVALKFNEGYIMELKRITAAYNTQKFQIDTVLARNNITYLASRFSMVSYTFILTLEEVILPKIIVSEYRNVA